MRKSFKFVTAIALTLSAVSISAAPVHAQNLESQALHYWTRRSVGEVADSINDALATSGEYVIQWGDTLSAIAQAIDLSVEEVAVVNQINNPDLIIAGNILTFDKENHQLTFTDASNEEITISTETGEVVEPFVEEEVIEELPATDGTIIDTVDEWVTPEEEVTEEELIEEEIVEEEVIEDDLTEEEITEEEIIEEPIIEEAVIEEPIIEEPVIEEPIIEEPIIEEPIIEEPIIEEDDSSLTVDPDENPWEVVEEEPIVEEPIIEEPIVEEPVIEEPVIEEPVATDPMDPYTAFSVITSEKGLSQYEIDGWSMIINRESGWNHTISNPSSGAYGLPQALPASKMASHGADWATNPYTQLAWMYDYMVGRYGSIQGAVDFWNANHWY